MLLATGYEIKVTAKPTSTGAMVLHHDAMTMSVVALILAKKTFESSCPESNAKFSDTKAFWTMR